MRSFSILSFLCAIALAMTAHAEVPLRWDATGHVVVPALANGTGPVDGLDLLRGSRVSLDYSGRRFWVAPSKCLSPVESHRGGYIK